MKTKTKTKIHIDCDSLSLWFIVSQILTELYTRIGIEHNDWRSSILSSLYGLVECTSAKILLSVARVVLVVTFLYFIFMLSLSFSFLFFSFALFLSITISLSLFSFWWSQDPFSFNLYLKLFQTFHFRQMAPTATQ